MKITNKKIVLAVWYKWVLLLITLGCANKSFASLKDTLYYVGNVKVSKKITYTYKLRFLVQPNNLVVGYSLSDVGGLYETKTKIVGKYDSAANTLYFEEQQILRSKVDTMKSDLCFIKATLAFKQDKMFETLSGKFVGFNPKTSSTCGKGEIKLINTKKIKKILLDANKIDDAKDVIVFDSKDKNTPQLIKIIDIKPKSLLFKESSINITVWDNGIVDNDIISIIANGVYILKNHTLDSVPKTITVTIPNNTDDLKLAVVAVNDGSEPPNTAMVIIQSLSDKYILEIRAQKNEFRTLYLSRRREKVIK